MGPSPLCPFPSWDRPISIEMFLPTRARLTSSSKERSIWHRQQAFPRLSPDDRFFFSFTCRFLRSKDGWLALLLGSGLSSEVNIEGSPPS
ncbi:unnamed protein product [Ilex paraguariensis]|uniref:Uncharacterized protein n=1 Tax=Ilex paraguariensis TaxID=185542 RepID=A0ABC8UKG9_9AQUA